MVWEFLLLGLIGTGVRGYYSSKGSGIGRGKFIGGKLGPKAAEKYSQLREEAKTDPEKAKQLEKLTRDLYISEETAKEYKGKTFGDGTQTGGLQLGKEPDWDRKKDDVKDLSPLGEYAKAKGYSSESMAAAGQIKAYAKSAGITVEEAKQQLAAIESFTGPNYSKIRQSQIDGKPSQEAKSIENFLSKQTPYKGGETYRGLSFESKAEADAFVSKLRSGSPTKAIASWSSDPEIAALYGLAQGRGDVKVLLRNTKNRSGVPIKGVSANVYESEVLAPSGAKYKIKNVTEHGAGYTIPGDPLKQQSGKGSTTIVIDLEEI